MIAATPITRHTPENPSSPGTALSRAIDRVDDGHHPLRAASLSFVNQARAHANTFVQSSCTDTTAAALGVVNGRLGREAGAVGTCGVPLDSVVVIVGHLGGLLFSWTGDRADPYFDVLAETFHTVGDTGLATSVYRLFHQRDVAAAQRAGGERGPTTTVRSA